MIDDNDPVKQAEQILREHNADHSPVDVTVHRCGEDEIHFVIAFPALKETRTIRFTRMKATRLAKMILEMVTFEDD